MFVAIAYNSIPQVNKAEEARQQNQLLRQQMQAIASNLLLEQKRTHRLAQSVDRLREQVREMKQSATSTSPVPQRDQGAEAAIASLRRELHRRPKRPTDAMHKITNYLDMIKRASQNIGWNEGERLVEVLRIVKWAQEVGVQEEVA